MHPTLTVINSWFWKVLQYCSNHTPYASLHVLSLLPYSTLQNVKSRQWKWSRIWHTTPLSSCCYLCNTTVEEMSNILVCCLGNRLYSVHTISSVLLSPHFQYYCYNINLYVLADMLLHRWKKAKELNRLATERFETQKSSCIGIPYCLLQEYLWMEVVATFFCSFCDHRYGCENERSIVTSSNI